MDSLRKRRNKSKIWTPLRKEEQVKDMNPPRTKGEQVDNMDPPRKGGVIMRLTSMMGMTDADKVRHSLVDDSILSLG